MENFCEEALQFDFIEIYRQTVYQTLLIQNDCSSLKVLSQMPFTKRTTVFTKSVMFVKSLGVKRYLFFSFLGEAVCLEAVSNRRNDMY